MPVREIQLSVKKKNSKFATHIMAGQPSWVVVQWSQGQPQHVETSSPFTVKDLTVDWVNLKLTARVDSRGGHHCSKEHSEVE